MSTSKYSQNSIFNVEIEKDEEFKKVLNFNENMKSEITEHQNNDAEKLKKYRETLYQDKVEEMK